MNLAFDRPATPDEAAAIAAALAVVLTEVPEEPPAPAIAPWAMAARVESLGIVRRIPGKLDLRYMRAIHGNGR